MRWGLVERWSVLELHGLEACGVPRASLGVCLRGAGARVHTGVKSAPKAGERSESEPKNLVLASIVFGR